MNYKRKILLKSGTQILCFYLKREKSNVVKNKNNYIKNKDYYK